MRRSCTLRLGWIFLAFVTALSGASCSDANDDSVGRACKTIVKECGPNGTMGDCIDAVGSLTEDCLDCFSEQGCDYASCQRIPGCRVPANLVKE
jgi:hypothetical protein